jgi:hypothetical protein
MRTNCAQERRPLIYNSGENSRAEDSTRRVRKGARRASRKRYVIARDKSAWNIAASRISFAPAQRGSASTGNGFSMCIFGRNKCRT